MELLWNGLPCAGQLLTLASLHERCLATNSRYFELLALFLTLANLITMFQEIKNIFEKQNCSIHIYLFIYLFLYLYILVCVL